MRLLLPILALAACDASTPAVTDVPDVTPVCEETRFQLYDIDFDPARFAAVDPTFGLSAEQMEAMVWGESEGTLTPTDGNPVGVAMLFGVDGNVEVREYQPAECGVEWRAVMFVVMSTAEAVPPYTVDDIWTVDARATSTTDATATGVKPAADFDGSLPATGAVTFTATRTGNTWTGEILDDSGVLATYTTTPVE